MTSYIDKMIVSLHEKLGNFSIEETEFKNLPYCDRTRFNLYKVIGNKNLISKRFKTEKEADDLVNSFLTAKLPG